MQGVHAFPLYNNAGGGACSVHAQDMTWLAQWAVHVCQRVPEAPAMQLALCANLTCLSDQACCSVVWDAGLRLSGQMRASEAQEGAPGVGRCAW